MLGPRGLKHGFLHNRFFQKVTCVCKSMRHATYMCESSFVIHVRMQATIQTRVEMPKQCLVGQGALPVRPFVNKNHVAVGRQSAHSHGAARGLSWGNRRTVPGRSPANREHVRARALSCPNTGARAKVFQRRPKMAAERTWCHRRRDDMHHPSK